jgi:hypothetical protein
MALVRPSDRRLVFLDRLRPLHVLDGDTCCVGQGIGVDKTGPGPGLTKAVINSRHQHSRIYRGQAIG